MITFIHIHKCGGSSLQRTIRRNFKQTDTSTVKLSSVEVSGNRLAQSIQSAAKRDGFIMGHIAYGAHRLFESEAYYITMLREPKSRLISLYRHAHRDPLAYYHHAAQGRTFEEFLNSKEVLEVDNGMTRFLSGDPSGEEYFINPKPFGTLDETDLERAKNNLFNKLKCFGILEHFDESLLLFKQRVLLTKPFYLLSNQTPSSIPKPKFPDQGANLVQFDSALYECAVSKFNESLESIPHLEEKLTRLKLINRRLYPLLWIEDRARKAARKTLNLISS